MLLQPLEKWKPFVDYNEFLEQEYAETGQVMSWVSHEMNNVYVCVCNKEREREREKGRREQEGEVVVVLDDDDEFDCTLVTSTTSCTFYFYPIGESHAV